MLYVIHSSSSGTRLLIDLSAECSMQWDHGRHGRLWEAFRVTFRHSWHDVLSTRRQFVHVFQRRSCACAWHSSNTLSEYVVVLEEEQPSDWRAEVAAGDDKTLKEWQDSNCITDFDDFSTVVSKKGTDVPGDWVGIRWI